MLNRFQTYFENLEGLSTEELDAAPQKLVRGEMKHTAQAIARIAEMARRKGALERGYKNLFEYCVRRLNLSEGSVAMRIQVANVCRRFPQLLAALADNRVSLTVAALLAPHLTEDNVQKLLAECRGMTKREAEEYLVALRPRPVFTPSIRKTPSRPRTNEGSLPLPAEGAGSSLPATRTTSDPSPAPATPKPSNVLQPATPELYNFRFAAGREFKEKLDRLAEVLGVTHPLQHMAEILEKAVDIALDKKDPKRKRERRLARQSAGKENKQRKPRPDEVAGYPPEATSRYIPAEVRERVLARGEYRCEYTSPEGTRCTSRTGLEIEHERPFAVYHDHDERFLRLFCRDHDRWRAERVYGAMLIRETIAAARRSRTGRARGS